MRERNPIHQEVTELTQFLESAKLYMKVVDFDKAIEMLVNAREQARNHKIWQTYQDAATLLLRIYGERLEVQKASEVALEIFRHAHVNEFEISSGFHYVFGICEFNQGRIDQALNSFESTIARALEEQKHRDVACGILGKLTCYLERQETRIATETVSVLHHLIEEHQISELKPLLKLRRVWLLLTVKEYDEAKLILDGLRSETTGTYDGSLTCSILYYYGELYLNLGIHEQALTYLELAATLIDRKNLKFMALKVDRLLTRINRSASTGTDLEISFGEQIEINERELGRVAIKGQHILRDLLELFANKIGLPQDKDQIVHKLWKCEYDPLIHDNKIYVTIKRLRQLIEPDPKNPIYLLRSRDGYYLNDNRRIVIKSSCPYSK